MNANINKVLLDDAHNFDYYDDIRYEELIVKVNKILSELGINENTPDVDKLELINNYVKDNIKIRSNYFHAIDGDVPFDEREVKYRTAHAALIDEQAMCAGFTEAVRCLLEASGIETRTLITKLPGKNKQLLHYVCACNIDGKNLIVDPERQGSCEKKGFDFQKYLDGMTYIIPEENFCRDKIGPTGLGPKASNYLEQEYALSASGLEGVEKIMNNELEIKHVQRC